MALLDDRHRRTRMTAARHSCNEGPMSDDFSMPPAVDPRLLEILVCPVTKGR
jgi:hypothetical protein